MNAATLIALQEIDSALDAIANKRPRLPEVAAHQSATAALNAMATAAAMAVWVSLFIRCPCGV